MSNSTISQFKNLKTEIPDCKFILPGSGEIIFFKPFTTKDQKAILKAMEKDDYELAQEAFDALLTRCVTNDGFNPLAMYPRDRESLLIALRKESVKDEYTDSWECSNMLEEENDSGEKVKRRCGHENHVDIKLSELNFTQLDKGSFKKEIVLSDRDNCVLIMDMAKRGDEKCVMTHAKKNSKGLKDTSRTELLHATMASFIDSLKMGEDIVSNLAFTEKMDIIDDLCMKDRGEVQNYIKNLEKSGYDLNIGKQTCESCGKVTDRELEWMFFFAV